MATCAKETHPRKKFALNLFVRDYRSGRNGPSVRKIAEKANEKDQEPVPRLQVRSKMLLKNGLLFATNTLSSWRENISEKMQA